MRQTNSPQPDPMSAQRRSRPLEFFRQFLGTFFLDNTEEEGLSLWRQQIESTRFNSYAADALYVLDTILANPPQDLIERLEEGGGITLFHRPDEYTLIPYTFEETVAWLRDQTERFRAAYEDFQKER